jgi:hypothetical protein
VRNWRGKPLHSPANELRHAYSQLLIEASASGRLLYSADNDDAAGGPDTDTEARCQHSIDASQLNIVRAGTARSATRHRRFLDRTLSDHVWIDLTEEAGADDGVMDVAAEEAREQSFDDLCDHFIEFREDNINNPVAATLKYSLPIKHQSDVLKEQIEQFRGYRRERFSLFRRGPLVEETTIASNVGAMLRFLGYLFYEQQEALQGAPLDMSVFAMDDINQLVLSYVEWLERRRGSKRVARTEEEDEVAFQPVSCATVANDLNGLVSIVKFQLRDELGRRDRLLDQLRNLRSQAESYSMTQKRFEKAHPEWCSWQDLQVARERCRQEFDQADAANTWLSSASGGGDRRARLLQLRELCLLGLLTICPPPRCSVIRLLEWGKTLVQQPDKNWMLDLTDRSHAATRHKTHKRKGAIQLPLSMLLSPYLSLLREGGEGASVVGGAVFPSGVLSPSSSSTSPMSSSSFTTFVKQTFRKYTVEGRAPNPSLLRSIFTTWLYSLRYDTEDAFLQQIKASSAKWKAHSEHVAATVYNKEMVYQKKEFSMLLRFCEMYARRYAYDRQGEGDAEESGEEEGEERSGERGSDSPSRTRSASGGSTRPTRQKRGSSDEQTREYVVDELTDMRVNDQGEKQVLVKWAGYKRRTWEPFLFMQQQLPHMMSNLLATTVVQVDDDRANAARRAFLLEFIQAHHVDATYRWSSDRLMTLEYAASSLVPPIRDTAKKLKESIMELVHAEEAEM